MYVWCVDECFQLANDASSSESATAAALPVVELPDAEPRAFELVLSYIYTDCIVPVKQGHSSSSKKQSKVKLGYTRIIVRSKA